MAAGSRRGVAQVVECLLREQEAASSSLATPTRFFTDNTVSGCSSGG